MFGFVGRRHRYSGAFVVQAVDLALELANAPGSFNALDFVKKSFLWVRHLKQLNEMTERQLIDFSHSDFSIHVKH
jgi:hypothetical protein